MVNFWRNGEWWHAVSLGRFARYSFHPPPLKIVLIFIQFSGKMSQIIAWNPSHRSWVPFRKSWNCYCNQRSSALQSNSLNPKRCKRSDCVVVLKLVPNSIEFFHTNKIHIFGFGFYINLRKYEQFKDPKKWTSILWDHWYFSWIDSEQQITWEPCTDSLFLIPGKHLLPSQRTTTPLDVLFQIRLQNRLDRTWY